MTCLPMARQKHYYIVEILTFHAYDHDPLYCKKWVLQTQFDAVTLPLYMHDSLVPSDIRAFFLGESDCLMPTALLALTLSKPIPIYSHLDTSRPKGPLSLLKVAVLACTTDLTIYKLPRFFCSTDVDAEYTLSCHPTFFFLLDNHLLTPVINLILKSFKVI